MKGVKNYLKAQMLHKTMYALPPSTKEKQKKLIYKEYLYYLRKAAYSGNAEAQYDLAQQYETMNYLSIQNPMYDTKKCIYWYTKSCMQNHAAACNNLASFFETGDGVKKDLNKALMLYKKSGDLGYAIGFKNYKIMKKQMQKSTPRSRQPLSGV